MAPGWSAANRLTSVRLDEGVFVIWTTWGWKCSLFPELPATTSEIEQQRAVDEKILALRGTPPVT